MMDKGNLLVADYIMAWLTKNGIGAQR
jgi:hypothetical protein